MKKIILIFITIFCFFLSSCETATTSSEQDDEQKEKEVYHIVTFDYNLDDEIYEVDVLDGDKVPSIIVHEYEGTKKFAGWSLTNNIEDLYDMNNPVTTDLVLYAVWEDYQKDYSYFLDDYVPNEITTSIELPQQIEYIMLMWDTSDTTILSKTGEFSPPRKDQYLTVYLSVFDDGEITSYEKEVLVRGLNLAKLKVENLVVGDYSTWNFFGYTDTILETCDVINLCFAYVNANYTLDYQDITSYITKVMKAHEQGVRVCLSIQGYSSGGTNFSKAAKTESGRKKLAASMLAVVEKYHLDGIDIDWEYPGFNTGTSTQVDKANYTLLLKTIRETLDEKDETYILSAAIPGGPYLTSRFDLSGVCEYLDYICSMTYDLNTSNASHHTALYDSSGTGSGCSANATVKDYLNKGVPKTKILLGIAFYGKYTTASKLGGSGSGTKTITYTKIKSEYLSRLGNGVTYYYDKIAEAPYLLDTTNNLFITYDDETSILAKCNYAINQGLGGVMIWEIGEDQTDTLIKAVKQGMNK